MAKKVSSNKASTEATSTISKNSIDPVLELNIQDGTYRPFIVTSPSPILAKIRSVNKQDGIYLIALLIISIYTRLQKLFQPDSVVFDEVHFGGFAKKYILGTFFMDVHPPLAKMLFAGVGSLAGFKGDFDFAKIGDVYPDTTPYFQLRAFSAVLGLATVVLFFLTLKASGVRPLVAFISSLIFSFENSYVTISRYILLDSPLIFFIAASAYSFKRFQNEVPFTFGWFRSLFATGVALGLAVSSKWVGLFTIAWIGLLNVWDLWFLIGDLSLPVSKIFKQTVSRGLILLVVPTILYVFFFSVHFNLLYREGDGGAFMTSAFRSTLAGNKIPSNILADVGVGSVVSIRHVATQGGYLHSHEHMYETGSKQQQITLYPHLDANNNWEISLYNETEFPTTFVPITDGTKIRLKHTLTHRRLHSHDHKAPVTENDWQKEASAYGFEGFDGDANDDFVVEIQKKFSKPGKASETVRSLETVFRLRHAMSGCYLFSHEVKLPKWGFEQQEVTCATQGKIDRSLWYIEQNESPFLTEESERINYEVPSLWAKIVESHQRMWHINKNLNSPHNYESSASSWPFLLRGINYWGENNRQVYLFGNVPVWWSTSFLIFAFAIYVVIQILRWQLGERVASDPHVYNFNVQTFHYILGWLLHYFPSFLMGRQLFLHHYLPAYYFGLLALAHFLDVLVSYVFSRKRTVGYTFVIGFALLAFVFYVNYSPLIYANPWTKAQCESSKFLAGWDFDCNKFHEKLSDYSPSPSASSPYTKIFDNVETSFALQ